MESLICDMLHSSIKNLFANQPSVLNNTTETTMTEWNLANHYSYEIAKYIFWLDHDTELLKKSYGGKRPDIIFHKRGTNDYNFLVIELKINDSISKDDFNKIKHNWLVNELKYAYGACVSIKNNENYAISVFNNKANTEKENCEYKYIKIPEKTKFNSLKNNPPRNNELILRMEEITGIFYD